MPTNRLELFLSLDDAVRLEEALAAFDRLIAGGPPGPVEVAEAPLIAGWRRVAVPVPEPALAGVVEGHPRLPGRRAVVTSRLLALDPEAGWARTTSRLYRLGKPGPEGPPDVRAPPVPAA